jgi:type IV fimbrial biogenesis protein FimT
MLSRNASPADRAIRGFTLVELMVALAVIGVTATLAAPDLSRLMANYRVRGEAESVLNGLNFARAEAVRRNSAVTFALGSGTTRWSVRQVSPATTLQAQSANDALGTTVSSSTSNTSVTFISTGLLQAGTQMSQVSVVSSVTGAKTRRINIFGGGLIRMCEPDVTATNDPRRC